MGYTRICLSALCAAVLAALPASVHAASKLVLTIRAGNPADFPQTVEVKADLPERVTTNDVISAGGLDVLYDVKKGSYYVYKQFELGSNELRRFTVEIRDIWIVSDEELDNLRSHTVELAAKLQGKEPEDEAAPLVESVLRELDAVKVRQDVNSIASGTRPPQHIGAYETNRKVLGGVRRDIGRLENMVMSTGQDPGALVAPSEDEPRPIRTVRLPDAEYKTAVIKVTVRNTSPTSPRTVQVRRELPEEILATDVLDADGMDVGTDAASGVTYVSKDVEVPPGETVEFNVRVRDKWNINGPRVAALKAEAGELLTAVGAEAKFESVEEVLHTLMGSLDEIGAETGPEKLDRAYVAFYRRQAQRLDIAEQTLIRIRSAMRANKVSQRFGIGQVKPPSPKTTWAIIYIVLGFLGLVSLLFFVRWYGKTGAEKMESGGGDTGA